jgi:hypothetical protein
MVVCHLAVAAGLHLHLHRAAEVAVPSRLAAAHLFPTSLGQNPHRGLFLEIVVPRLQEAVSRAVEEVASSPVEANRPWKSMSTFVVDK